MLTNRQTRIISPHGWSEDNTVEEVMHESNPWVVSCTSILLNSLQKRFVCQPPKRRFRTLFRASLWWSIYYYYFFFQLLRVFFNSFYFMKLTSPWILRKGKRKQRAWLYYRIVGIWYPYRDIAFLKKYLRPSKCLYIYW